MTNITLVIISFSRLVIMVIRRNEWFALGSLVNSLALNKTFSLSKSTPAPRSKTFVCVNLLPTRIQRLRWNWASGWGLWRCSRSRWIHVGLSSDQWPLQCFCNCSYKYLISQYLPGGLWIRLFCGGEKRETIYICKNIVLACFLACL